MDVFFEIKQMSRVMLAQREIESTDSEKLNDITDSKVCAGDVCGLIWKPSQNESDLGENLEQ